MHHKAVLRIRDTHLVSQFSKPLQKQPDVNFLLYQTDVPAQILPCRRLLIIDTDGTAIYDIPESLSNAAQSEPLLEPTQTPRWSMSYSQVPHSYEKYFTASPTFRGALYLYIYNGKTVYRVRTPTDEAADFQLVDSFSAKTKEERYTILGDHRAISWTNDPYTDDLDVSCIAYSTQHLRTGFSEVTSIVDSPVP